MLKYKDEKYSIVGKEKEGKDGNRSKESNLTLENVDSSKRCYGDFGPVFGNRFKYHITVNSHGRRFT